MHFCCQQLFGHKVIWSTPLSLTLPLQRGFASVIARKRLCSFLLRVCLPWEIRWRCQPFPGGGPYMKILTCSMNKRMEEVFLFLMPDGWFQAEVTTLSSLLFKVDLMVSSLNKVVTSYVNKSCATFSVNCPFHVQTWVGSNICGSRVWQCFSIRAEVAQWSREWAGFSVNRPGLNPHFDTFYILQLG